MRCKTITLSNNTFESKEVHYQAVSLLVAVDCIVFGFDNERLKLLLFKRKVEPFKDTWSLIGSFVKSDENVSDAAHRILQESTGITGIFLSELGSFSDPCRDPGGRVLSIAHYALMRLEEQDLQAVTNFQAQWFDVEAIPDLILDHNIMVAKSLERLRENARNHPIGFELLSEKFTIPQLQALYEAIYQQKLDRRNFRKKIKAMGFLEKLNEKDKSGSKKGAFLYRFNKDEYENLMKKGFSFMI